METLWQSLGWTAIFILMALALWGLGSIQASLMASGRTERAQAAQEEKATNAALDASNAYQPGERTLTDLAEQVAQMELRLRALELEREIGRTIEDIVNHFDALAPKYTYAPDWARWYTIDAEGSSCWHESEPIHNRMGWRSSSRYKYTGDVVESPLGIDWKLCKWQQPEVEP